MASAAPMLTATPTAPNAADAVADPAKAKILEVSSAVRLTRPAVMIEFSMKDLMSAVIALIAITPLPLTPTPTPPAAKATDAASTAELMVCSAVAVWIRAPAAMTVESFT